MCSVCRARLKLFLHADKPLHIPPRIEAAHIAVHFQVLQVQARHQAFSRQFFVPDGCAGLIFAVFTHEAVNQRAGCVENTAGVVQVGAQAEAV